MSKTEFLEQLRRGLSGCPEQEKEERIAFYDEMISDYLEEGLTESEAVAKIGDPRDIAAGIMADLPLSALVKERIKPGRKLKGWELILLILGSPIWVSLVITAIAVIFSICSGLVHSRCCLRGRPRTCGRSNLCSCLRYIHFLGFGNDDDRYRSVLCRRSDRTLYRMYQIHGCDGKTHTFNTARYQESFYQKGRDSRGLTIRLIKREEYK